MASRIRDHKIHLATYRRKLTPRREPYWRQIDTGRHLGYRKTEDESESWVARYTDDGLDYHYQNPRLSGLSFSDARERADEWFKQCREG